MPDLSQDVKPLRVDFNKPCLFGNELKYIAQTFSDAHISGDGSFSRKCQRLLESELGVPKVLLTTSCTHALEMAALLLDIQPGDEVIVPSFTFVSTINAFVLRGARPVFIDIHPETMNLNETQLGALITPRTRAILPVHYAGVGCEMDAILEIAGQYHLAVVEDNAHGLFGKYKGKFLGTFGILATQSFHETKNITCGEGGALLINNPELIERAEIIREKGTNRNRFFRGLVDKYTWVDIGSSYVLSDVLGAILFAQLEAREEIQSRRKTLWNYYNENLKGWAAKRDVQIPFVPVYCEQSYHMYYLVVPSLKIRQAFISHQRDRGILSVFHYQALHLSNVGRRYGGKEGNCPVTERTSDCLLRLPFYTMLSQAEQDIVLDAIFDFRF